MSRQSSPDLEIVAEVCQSQPMVEVIYPKSASNTQPPPPLIRWKRPDVYPPRQVALYTGVNGNSANCARPPPQHTTNFAPKIAEVRTLLQPLFKCKPNQSAEVVPGIWVHSRPNQEQIQGINLQGRQICRISNVPTANAGGATALMVVGNALNADQLGPISGISETRLNSRISFPQTPLSRSLPNVTGAKKKFKSQTQLNLDKKLNQRKRKHSSSSESSSSIIICDDEFPATKKCSINFQAERTNSQTLNNMAFYGRTKFSLTREDEQFDKPFQCGICEKILANNISMGSHAFSHFLNDDASEEIDLNILSTCWKCLRLMVDPYRLMDHISMVHSKSPPLTANICYICETECSDNNCLRLHMKTVHNNAVDMPYVCSICHFQSSLYEDVANHFAEVHKNSLLLLCPLCLTVIQGSPESNGRYKNVAGTIAFSQHILTHIERKDPIRCDSCRLQFISNSDLVKHRNKHHNLKKSFGQLMTINFDGNRPMTYAEQRGQLTKSNRVLLTLENNFDESESRCIECRRLLTDDSHFLKSGPKQCPVCFSFATSCCFSYQIHMAEHAANGSTAISHHIFQRRESVLDDIGVCSCGFSSKVGNKIAKHLHFNSYSCGEVVLQVDPLDAKPLTPPDDVMPKSIAAALDLCPINGVVQQENEIIDEHEEDTKNLNPLGGNDTVMELDIDLSVPSHRRLSLLSPNKNKNIYASEMSVPGCSSEETKKIKPEPTVSSRQRLLNNFMMKSKHRLFKADRLSKNVDTLCEQYSIRRRCKPDKKLMLDVLSTMNSPNDMQEQTSTGKISSTIPTINSDSAQNGSPKLSLDKADASTANLNLDYISNGDSSPMNIFDKLLRNFV